MYLKKTVFSLLMAFLSLPLSLQAQNAEITGTVIDNESSPLINATVAVYEKGAPDTPISGTVTNVDGNFTLMVDPDDYLLRVSFLSFQDLEQEVQLEEGQVLDIGTVQMKPTQSELGEVEVQGQRSYMEMNFDSRSFNVGEDVTSLGGSALDVLDNVPSITTDFEGNVSLRGNQGVQILINGRPSNLVRNGTDALSSIPAGLIEEVKIITNPSARYSANGTGGIIDIILVDDAELGLNGSVRLNTGIPQDNSIGVNLNYQRKSINWFMNTQFEYEQDPRSSRTFQSFSRDTTFAYRESSDWDEQEVEGSLDLGADIFLPGDQVLTVEGRLNLEAGDEDRNVNYTDYDPLNNEIYRSVNNSWPIIAESVRDVNDEQDESDYEARIQYEKIFGGNDDHILTADADFEWGIEEERSLLEQRIISGVGEGEQQRTFGNEDYRDFRMDVDYERAIRENGKFEAGIRFNYETEDSDYLVEEFQNGVWAEATEEFGATDNFEYLENVNSAYAIYSGELKPITYQIGLRAENTRIETQLTGSGQGSDQNYINLFPSLFLSYTLNEQNSFQASYSRRISRPRSWYLLPYTEITDNRNRRTGNPDLEPEFGDSYEAGYLRYWESGSLLTSLYYRHRTQVIERVSIIENDGITTRTPINLATEDAWGVELSADQDITENLQLSGSLNLYQSESEGEFQDVVYASKSDNFTSRLRVRWTFLEKWNFQSYLYYRGPSETTQGRRSSRSFVGSGLSRKLLDEKATISVNVRDLFNSRNGDREVIEPFTYSSSSYSWSSRTVRVNFRYNFGR
ncbi:MAG TPA: outer membrane beta-barrel family protein [Gracilimonas sp.]|nr:outer membrane beta-barrel family protein [Gracilimonas sp.]